MAKYHQIAGYDVVATLGSGAGSTLYAVRDGKGTVYCLKQVIKKNPQEQRFLDQALLEHNIAKRFDHPQLRKSFKVIKVREIIRVSEVLVLMEMVDGLSLEQHRPSDLLTLVRICRDVASALHAMHQQGYVHADIKPNNIMLTESGQVKIIDFGQSCPVGTIKERIQGTPDYIAPEQVRREAITEQTDVYNFGATMYWMLTGKNVPSVMPRKLQGVALKTDDYQKCPPPAELNPQVSPALSQLVMDCIQRQPENRPAGMSSVIDRLDIAITQIERARKEGSAPRSTFPAPGSAPHQVNGHARPTAVGDDDHDSTVELDMHDTAQLGGAAPHTT